MLTKYPSSELKCVFIQDGTNSISKGKFEFLNDLINIEELIKLLVQKTHLKQCEIPPFLDNVEANKNVDLYNDDINCTYGSEYGYQLLKLNTMIKINNKFLFWDKINLNGEHGVPCYAAASDFSHANTPINYHAQKFRKTSIIRSKTIL